MYKYLGHIDPENPERRDAVPGLPARDISEEEAKERGWESLLRASVLYTREPQKTAQAPAGQESGSAEGN